MHRLKIAIDPLLRERHAPEICWAWRFLLSGMGYAWEEVAPGDEQCDIAYVAEPGLAPHARIHILANSSRWSRPSAWRLEQVAHYDTLRYPLFYGEQEQAQLVHITEQRAICERDLLFDLYWLVTGQEEPGRPKNVHGYLDLEGTPYLRDNALRLGLASGIGSWLQGLLGEFGFPAPLARWPYGKRAAASASHDVDYPEVIRWLEPARILARQGMQGIGNALAVITGQRHHWHFGSWMQLEQRLGTRSAFYFVARRGSLPEYAAGTPDSFYDIRRPRFRKLFGELAQAGFEIGLHGSYQAYTSRERFAAEKQRLEEACGQPVTGHRHHYWHLDPHNPEDTLLMHEQLGFRYDASLTNDHYLGWRRGSCWPFFPFHQDLRRELQTLQLPTGWMDDQLFGQRANNPGDRQELLRALVDQAAAQGGMILIDIHDYVYDDALFPGWARTYREMWEYIVERGDYWIDTPARIAEHWSARYATLVRASSGLGAGSNSRADGAVYSDLYLPTVS